jgi:hypothetical protein
MKLTKQLPVRLVVDKAVVGHDTLVLLAGERHGGSMTGIVNATGLVRLEYIKGILQPPKGKR